ncbi:hypothetical protein KPSA3_04683 [Pseudomonas syringae pv. actinidiae]|uniref:Uncharacterized protein n=1 Tax=Pseudomonas syringae pv. actinidiae TaxID=103796 RepID=A0AAN4TM75_PSESF|nr:hypothetical protein KPSA3_04683 [Pseudomonas syringae pv. actinidiae]
MRAFIEFVTQLQGLFAAFDTGAGEHQLIDACGIGAVEYRLSLRGKACIGQIDADVDELHGATSS